MNVYILVVVFLVLIAFLLIENKRELGRFQVTTYNITSFKLAGLKSKKKIIFLSDLHNCSYGKENQELLDAIIEAKPDLILIGGDMLVRKDGCSHIETLIFLQELPQVCPVYYANGNHEQKLKEYPDRYQQSYQDYKERLLHMGIHLLENESANIVLDNARLQITGLEIPIEGYRRLHRMKLSLSDVEERIGKSTEDYQILLAHNPRYVQVYKDWGADLILSGHLHGGVMRLPGIGGVIGPDLTIFPKYSGDLYQEGDTSIVVSKGLGVHSIPIRLFNPAEMIVLEIENELEK